MKILNILKTPINTTVLILALSGCSGEKEHDINYYLEHPEERKVKLEACHGDVRKRDANCLNAEEALSRAILNPQNTKMPKIK